jgi:rhodanese-related sulfurtransferase
VAQQLRRLGYGDVRLLKGGLAAWASAGLALEPKPA